MLRQIFKKIPRQDFRSYFTMGAVGVYLIAVVSFAVAWAGTKVIQRNYQLMREISVLEQEADISRAMVENQRLRNEYYESDDYLELAARRRLNKAAPGEKLLIVSKEVALSKVQVTPEVDTNNKEQKQSSSNWQAWLKFLTGRGLE